MKMPKGFSDFRVIANGEGLYTTQVTFNTQFISLTKAQRFITKNGKTLLEKQLHYKIEKNSLLKRKRK